MDCPRPAKLARALTVRDGLLATSQTLSCDLLEVVLGLADANGLAMRQAKREGRQQVDDRAMVSSPTELNALAVVVKTAADRFPRYGARRIVAACGWFVLAFLKFDSTGFGAALPANYADVCLWLASSDRASPARQTLMGFVVVD